MLRRCPQACRSRSAKRLTNGVAIVSIISLLGSVFLMLGDNRNLNLDQALLIDKNIPISCSCVDNETKIAYNFCYRLHSKFGVEGVGKRFSCEWLPIIKELGLLDLFLNDYFQFDRQILPEFPPFVTAASESHFHQSLTFMKTVHKFFKSSKQRVIFYDLGLSNASVALLRRLCNVEYRLFPFDRYPTWVRSLAEYRWKPLLIAEALKQHGAIWYMDSSVQLEKSNLSHVYALLNCRSKFRAPFHTFTTGPTPVNAKFIESGFHADLWSESVRRCDKFAYMLQGFTGHGIFSTTHPGVYKYIPTIQEKIKQETCKMYEAGHLFAVRTIEVVQDVLKWYVLCALERDCMAPAGARLSCVFNNDRYGIYANCHRFDQSVVNLLLANRNYFNSYYWISGIVDFFHIVRGGGLFSQDLNAQLKECAGNDTIIKF